MDGERGIPLEPPGSFLNAAHDPDTSHTRRTCLATRGSLIPLRGWLTWRTCSTWLASQTRRTCLATRGSDDTSSSEHSSRISYTVLHVVFFINRGCCKVTHAHCRCGTWRHTHCLIDTRIAHSPTRRWRTWRTLATSDFYRGCCKGPPPPPPPSAPPTPPTLIGSSRSSLSLSL